MGDGIAEMVRESANCGKCNLPIDFLGAHIKHCACGKDSPLDKASSALAEAGTPLVADVLFDELQRTCGKTDVRTFDTGATRDSDEGKPRYHAYSCPLVDQSFGNYMLKHQKQSDGTMRPADNWKKRMPLDEVLESLIRHVEDLRLHHDGYVDQCREKDIHEVLNGCRANINFYHHGIIQDELEMRKPI